MKPPFLPFTAVACLILSSCAHRAPAPPTPSEAQAAATQKERSYYESYGREYERERREKATAPPRRGMTRDEVRVEYGRPLSITSNVRSEVWNYSFNGTDSRASSPFHDTSATIRCVITFDQRTGKVDNFTWTASNPVVLGGASNGGSYYRRY